MQTTTAALGAWLVLSSLNVQADEVIPTYKKLKERRQEMVMPKYTVQERELVLSQAHLLFEQMFVHREVKLRDFGIDSDPFPHLEKLAKDSSSITDSEFHDRMGSIFNKQHDFHTLYSFPAPYSCYRTFIPLSFKEVLGTKNEKIIAISQIADNPEIWELMPSPFPISLGDQVLTYDGKNISELIKANIPKSNGANPDAMKNHAASMLTYFNQGYDLAPETNEVTLVMKKRTGKIYTVTLPWVSRVFQDCLKTDDKTKAFAPNTTQNEINQLFRKTYSNKSVGTDELKSSAEPILTYKTINNEYGTFAFLRLESFSPERLSVEQLVLETKRLLVEEFQDTDGLIIDLRSNGGGQIELADKLVQLFTPKNPMPLNFVLNASVANLHWWENIEPSSPYTKTLHEAFELGTAYTRPIPLHNKKEVGLIGQYYFKPVALMTDGSCYSSCDMFSALMQDQGVATVFGEDSTTGAGGANVYYWNSVVGDLQNKDPGPFKYLPARQTMSFSWRQTYRVGKSKGETLEDVGVVSDYRIFPKLSDLYDASASQVKTITKKLNSLTAKYDSSVELSSNERQDIELGQQAEVFAKWTGTDTFVFKSKRKTAGKFNVELSNNDGKKLAIPESLTPKKLEISDFEILGYKNNKRVWRKIVNYRSVPPFFSTQSNELKVDLSAGLPAYMGLYSQHTAKVEGWNIANNELRIGRDEQYAINVYAEAALFLNLPEQKELKLSFSTNVKTEENYDFFSVLIRVEGEEYYLIKNQSGNIGSENHQFDLTQLAGKKVEIRFIFTSDPGTNDEGVTVKDIALTAI